MVAKTVDSYRFLDGIGKRAMKRWAGLARGNTDSMDSSRHAAFEIHRVPGEFNGDRLENRSPDYPAIERRDPLCVEGTVSKIREYPGTTPSIDEKHPLLRFAGLSGIDPP